MQFFSSAGSTINIIPAKFLLGLVAVGGFVGGAVITFLHVLVCFIVIQRCRCHLKKSTIDVNDNVAYETVKITRSKSNSN